MLFFIFLLCGLASALANRSMDPLITQIARDFSVPVTTAALLSSAYAFPYAFSQPVIGAIGDFYGKSIVLRCCLWMLTFCILGCVAAPNFETLFVSRLLGGVFGGGVVPVAMAMIGDRYEPARRQLAIGRFLTASLTGMVFGASIAGYMAVTIGWRSFFVLAGCIALAAAIGATLMLRETTARKSPGQHLRFSDAAAGYRQVLSNPKAYLCFGTVFAEGVLFYGVTPYIGQLLEAAHLGTAREAGFVLGSFGLGGLLYSLTLHVTLRFLHRLQMMAIGGVLAVSGLVGVALALPWQAQASLFVISGLGFMMLHNSVQTEVADLAPAARASAFAGHSAAFFLGQAVGPVIVGLVLQTAGRQALIVNAILLASTGILVSRLFRGYRKSGAF